MHPKHTNYVEYVFEKNHKSCLNYPISSWKRFSKLSISDKILHLFDCDKIEPIKEISTDKEVVANMDNPVKEEYQKEEKMYQTWDLFLYW